MIPNRRRIRHLLPLLLFLPGLIYSILTLTAFPFVHSDEVWLAELSREIGTTGNLSATEPFFRLTDRYPHGMKILFHLIQAPLVSHSFSPAAARLPSLLAGWLSVILHQLSWNYPLNGIGDSGGWRRCSSPGTFNFSTPPTSPVKRPCCFPFCWEACSF